MSDPRSPGADPASPEATVGDRLETARSRLAAAEAADHETRLELVNEVYAVLEGELDEQTPASGR